MAGKKIKYYTLKNNYDKTILLRGIQFGVDLTLVPDQVVSVPVTDLAPGWSENLKSWAPFIAVGYEFKTLANPTMNFSVDPSTIKFVNGNTSTFDVKVLSKDYLNELVKFGVKLSGVDTLSAKAFDIKEQKWHDLTAGKMIVSLDTRSRKIPVELTLAENLDPKEYTVHMTAGLYDLADNPYEEPEFDLTSTPIAGVTPDSEVTSNLSEIKPKVGTETEFKVTINAGNQVGEKAICELRLSPVETDAKFEVFEDDWVLVKDSKLFNTGSEGLELTETTEVKLRVTMKSTDPVECSIDVNRARDGMNLGTVSGTIVASESKSRKASA